MDDKKRNDNVAEEKKNAAAEPSKEAYSLNDDRRVKVLSPGVMVAKRFFRNRLAMVGLFVLIAMFVFSFLGGLISPYKEDQLFYRYTYLKKEYAAAIENTEFRYLAAPEQSKAFGGTVQAYFILAQETGQDTFSYRGKNYKSVKEGDNFYSIYEIVSDSTETLLGIAYKDIFSISDPSFENSFDFTFAALKAYTNEQPEFVVGDVTYSVTEEGIITAGETEIGYVSRYVVQALMSDVFLTREFKELTIATIAENEAAGEATVTFELEDGSRQDYFFVKNPNTGKWTINQETASRIYDTYSSPSAEHWLGTDGYGFDMLTRLMYGGRVSLMIGFIVEIISTVLGVILGGISGYFGGWVDNLIMRIVDIFYCIPSMPIFIILGVAMDNMGVDPKLRMFYLMLILGFLGWPRIARLVRGQILSLREQEFMTATEACGIRASRRIFKHLIPNVIPQLIVSCTMGLGGTILTEATLSFLGLGVRFPFASWGNIINDVNNTFVLTNYWFIWIPAGVLLLLTVLAFNILGDGLRDAFDPKMKR